MINEEQLLKTLRKEKNFRYMKYILHFFVVLFAFVFPFIAIVCDVCGGILGMYDAVEMEIINHMIITAFCITLLLFVFFCYALIYVKMK